MVSRVIVSLLKEERQALIDLAHYELRTPSAQAHYLIREILRQLALLSQLSKEQDIKHTSAELNQEEND